MNLRDIEAILKLVDFQKSRLNSGTIQVNQGPQGHAVNVPGISNIHPFKNFLNAVRTIPGFEKEHEFLQQSPLFHTNQNSLQLDQNSLVQISDNAKTIHDGLNALARVLHVLLPPIDTNSVEIKLPEPSDFEEAIKYQDLFFRAISQNVINNQIEGKVILTEWEPGSFWLTLALGSAPAVGLVGGLAWAAAVVLKKYREGQLIMKMMDGIQIKNEALSELKKGVEASVELLIESEARSLEVQHFAQPQSTSSEVSEQQGERAARLRMGIETLMTLIDKGAEVHPALAAPESVQNLFPDFRKLDLIESKTKLIEAPKPTGESSETK